MEVSSSALPSTSVGSQTGGRQCRTRWEGPRCWKNEVESVKSVNR